MSLAGSNTIRGKTYLFRFPFDIYHTCGSDRFSLRWDGCSVYIYPLHPDYDGDAPATKQMTLEKVPYESGTRPPTVGGPTIERLSLSMSQFQNSSVGNSLRVDVFDPDCEDGKVIDLVGRFLDLIRAFTFQWWIHKDRQADRGYLRHLFEINERGERLRGVISTAQKYGGFHVEESLDRNQFEYLIQQAAAGKTPPFSFLTLADAIYYKGVEDHRRSIVDAAISCELLMLDDVPRLLTEDEQKREALRSRLDDYEFINRIENGTEMIDRSFKRVEPESFNWLEHLWTARNNVAHGKEAVFEKNGNVQRVASDELTEMIKAVLELIMYLQKHGSFTARST